MEKPTLFQKVNKEKLVFFSFQMEPKWRTDQAIQEYKLSDKYYKLKVGKLFEATYGEDGQMEYMIKRIKKNEKNQELIAKEESNMAKVTNSALRPLVSVFEDEKYVYHVFKGTLGKSVVELAKDHKLIKNYNKVFRIICYYFYSFLEALHRQNVFFLRPVFDNVFITDTGILHIYGLDADTERFGSYMLTADETITEYTDLLSFAEFVYFLYGEKELDIPNYKQSTLFLGVGPADMLQYIATMDLEKRKKFDPKKYEMLHPYLPILSYPTYLSIGTFSVNWTSGIIFSFGHSRVGFTDGLFFESDGTRLKITDDGIVLTQGSMNKCELSNSELKASITDFKWRIKKGVIKRKISKFTLNNKGLFLDYGNKAVRHCSITDDGLKYWYGAYGTDYLVISDEPECKLSPDKHKVDFGPKDGGFHACVDDFFEVSLSSAIKLRMGPAAIIVDKNKLKLVIKPIKITFKSSGEVKVKANDLKIKNEDDELKLTLGELTFELKGNRMRAECEGMIATYDQEGFQFENENMKYDLSEQNKAIPRIKVFSPKIRAPSSPPKPKLLSSQISKVPGMNPQAAALLDKIPEDFSIYDLFTRKDPEGEKRERSSIIPDDNVVFESLGQKTRFLSRKTRRFVLTKDHKIFYFTKDFEYQKGEIILSKDSKLEVKGETDLKVTSSTGRSYSLQFTSKKLRDQWETNIKNSINELTETNEPNPT